MTSSNTTIVIHVLILLLLWYGCSTKPISLILDILLADLSLERSDLPVGFRIEVIDACLLHHELLIVDRELFQLRE